MKNLAKLAFVAALCVNVAVLAGNDTDAGLHQRLGLGAHDSDTVLTSDELSAFFVRESPGTNGRSEIWKITIADHKSTPLVRMRPSDDPKRNLTEFQDLRLSPDNKILYFRTGAWATSTAVHAIDLRTGNIMFVTAGNSVQVVQKGQFKGHLIVDKHRYYVGGGSYDALWLVTQLGTELGPVLDIETVEAN
jgi:hypothetical protein